jgi:hypothetical protein
MRNIFLLTKNEQRIIAVVMIILVTAALANRYRNSSPASATRSTSTRQTETPSYSPTEKDEAERDDAP